MEAEAIPDWIESFTAFCARFDDLFARSETRQQARKYVRGLLAPLERKTTWQLAEGVQDETPDRMQRLLYRAPWDAEAARDRLQQFIIERFGEEEGIGVLDETGIPKKGKASVGVAKQYCGAVGKLENWKARDAVDLQHIALPCFFGSALVFARRLVLGYQAACACEGTRGCQLSDETRTSQRDAGTGLGAGSAHALGHWR
jgi:DDE superfamily endonuclease